MKLGQFTRDDCLTIAQQLQRVLQRRFNAMWRFIENKGRRNFPQFV
jgi:hypothetical protein